MGYFLSSCQPAQAYGSSPKTHFILESFKSTLQVSPQAPFAAMRLMKDAGTLETFHKVLIERFGSDYEIGHAERRLTKGGTLIKLPASE